MAPLRRLLSMQVPGARASPQNAREQLSCLVRGEAGLAAGAGQPVAGSAPPTIRLYRDMMGTFRSLCIELAQWIRFRIEARHVKQILRFRAVCMFIQGCKVRLYSFVGNNSSPLDMEPLSHSRTILKVPRYVQLGRLTGVAQLHASWSQNSAPFMGLVAHRGQNSMMRLPLRSYDFTM